ncbi:polysaccharide deacetylase family protein [Pseudanabaena sp. FACHB-2040]|uniref:polysaccharide deacetylase family protein n=1 Tax=Pseudanabaena sp. FACHB-2040 TaxID=2692859 RepID=UPI001686FCD3|nr:polysaccharide deacetylase family protein [Pseudanabaena sp. FACHB-2040]MBD2255941.1 polysaccharide deacetylase family protein [Pseudanabaena sp. FACHB-2040]
MFIESQQPRCHGLSIDVEEWFHILECGQTQPVTCWSKLDSRVNRNTEHVLNILDRYGVHATFFVLGWVAKQHPTVIQQICERGHQLGSHGYTHVMVSHMKPDEFAKDLDMSLTAISQAANKDVLAYRAPGFSITNAHLWAFEILASQGIKIDSSLFMGSHAHGGISLDRDSPFEIVLPSGKRLIEVPIVSLSILKKQIPFSGGGYLRLLPTPVVKKMFKLAEGRGSTLTVYVHPRDFDLYQPRMKLSPTRYFKYYVGLNGFSKKFEELLASFKFDSLENVTKNIRFSETFSLETPFEDKQSIS